MTNCLSQQQKQSKTIKEEQDIARQHNASFVQRSKFVVIKAKSANPEHARKISVFFRLYTHTACMLHHPPSSTRETHRGQWFYLKEYFYLRNANVAIMYRKDV